MKHLGTKMFYPQLKKQHDMHGKINKYISDDKISRKSGYTFRLFQLLFSI